MREKDVREKAPVILVVDDTPSYLEILGQLLVEEGYEVFAVKSGERALLMMERKIPDLILLDVTMPEMSGFEVCKKVKSLAHLKEIPIIFLTAKIEEEDVLRGFQLGAVDYVRKPFNVAELLSRVSTHLELKFSREELKKMNAHKDKFFSVISHDLRSPFSSLFTSSQMLAQEYEKFTDEERKKLLQGIGSKSKKIYYLLENLLQWSMAQIGRVTWRPEKIHLSSLLDESVYLFKEEAEKKDNRLQVEVGKDIQVYGDSNMIQTVLRNLVSNAIKFTSGGLILVTAREKGNWVEVIVSDTGVGMTEGDLEKIFNAEGHSTYGTANEKGSGLGLILCKEFVERNSGEFWVKSEIQKGSQFSFTLPKGGGVKEK